MGLGGARIRRSLVWLTAVVSILGVTSVVDRVGRDGGTAPHAHPLQPVPAAAMTPLALLPRTGWTVAADGHAVTIDMHAVATVAALTYRPRADAAVVRYQVSVSSDGVRWGSPVATGTFADDAAPKTVTFAAAAVRSVRLTALTATGAAGRWASGAEIDLLGGTVTTAAAGGGAWSATIGFPLVPVGAAMLRTGKLLTWSSADPYNFGGGGKTYTATLNPTTGVVSQRLVTETGHDMFCPGTAVLTDGRILVNGGVDSGKTSIYDPATDTWTAGPLMNIPRGYNADTVLPDGRVFTLGGSWSGGQGGKNGEAWSPTAGWQLLPGVPVDPILTADPQGVYRADNHGWFFATSGGRVFQAGPSKQMNWFDTTGGGGTTPAGLRGDDQDAMNGNAVMYDVGKILTVGGAPAYQNANATANAYVIDITNGVAVRKVASMTFARAFHNSVVLPDGKVLVIGGEAYPVPFSDDTAVLTPELWDPATETFTTMSAMTVPRNYHSVATLLPDGRVFSGGGGLCGGCTTNHPDGQIFTPPYLLNPDGTAASRPSITKAPGSASAGSAISVATKRAVARFALVRMGAATHSVDNDQRRIPLAPTSSSGTRYTLTIPADRGVVLPGYYMLFALDSAGVPSVARIIRIS
jgi:galactose oxidase